VTRGFAIGDGPLFLKLRRQGKTFSAWYSYDGRRWVDIGLIDATFADRVEVGVVAVNSSEQPLSAELEMLNVEDPQGSTARDYADPGPPEPSPPPPASTGDPQVRPRRPSMLLELGPKRKSPVKHAAPTTAGPTGFHW
jgi:hypothetical protein